MNVNLGNATSTSWTRSACVVLLLVALTWPGIAVFAQSETQPAAQESTPIKPEQLDALVAPIALYPDNLLAQVLVASTYPLELIQLHQWLQKNPDLQKDQKKLAEKVEKQPWDPSIQAMAPFPDTVKWLAEDIGWTGDLGNVFLAHQKEVMDAVQRMRAKAQKKGTLKSGEQLKVESQNVDNAEVIVIEQADPQVVYVPSYDPVVVYGDPYPYYPYPPIYYPPYYGGAIAAGAIGFGLGLALGAAWGGGWGWGCGWGGGDININSNNNFNRNTNINGGNRVNNIQGGNRVNGGNGKWSHNPSHRGGAPYGDRSTANKFGGTTRGDSLANRQGQANRDLGNRNNGIGDRNNLGGRNDSLGNRNDGLGSGNRGGSDRVGDRNVGSGDRSGGFGGGSGGFDRGSTRSSSDRGRSSMSSSSRGGFGGGGGMSRGGGFGGGRGGGGRRR